MIWEEDGIELIPGNHGKDCPANGEDPNVECCCDECGFLLCCLEEAEAPCSSCSVPDCPRIPTTRDE